VHECRKQRFQTTQAVACGAAVADDHERDDLRRAPHTEGGSHVWSEPDLDVERPEETLSIDKL
jgi:hypothetical protein